jgi:tetratricopeptide (TPR) repeat protein
LYYATKHYNEMIPIYEDIIRPGSPTYPGDMLQLGALYLKSGEQEKGRTCLESALEADEKLGRAHQMLGHLEEQHERWDEALEHYEKFIELEPAALREIFERLAETSLKARRPELTVDILERAIAQGDTSAWASEQLGWMYYNTSRLDESYEILHELKKRRAITENGLYIMGLGQMRREKYEDAAETFARVIELAPDYFLSYLARSNALMLLDKPELAGDVLKLGLESIDSTNAEGRRELMYSLANVCHEQGLDEQTESWLNKVLDLSPDYAPALNYLGYFYAEQGRNLEEAQRLVERALEHDPENGHYLDSMGWVLYKMGHAESALDYIISSLENLKKQQNQEKAYSEVYEHLGDIYLTLGKTELAREAWNSSLEIDRENQGVEQKLKDLNRRQDK